jgi:hypothetical protein
MTKNNHARRSKNVLFVGSMEIYQDLAESFVGCGFIYCPVSVKSVINNETLTDRINNAINRNGKPNLAIFEKSNKDVISKLRQQYEKLPIILMEGGFRNATTQKYNEMGVHFPMDIDGLKKQLDSYL